MRVLAACLMAVLIVAGLVVVSGSAMAQDTLYYRGYFDGQMTPLDRGVGWYTYKPATDSAYPLFESRHTSPLWYQFGPRDEKEKDESILSPSQTSVHTLTPLPGYYYYKQPAHYNFTTPMNNLGWPYRQYEHGSW